MPDSGLLRAAVGYATRGWAVLPLTPGGKTPATSRGVHDATTSVRQIREWWGARTDLNIGINAGRSGLVVIDLDGPDGAEEYGRLLRDLSAPGDAEHPDGVPVATGRGWHLYLAAPTGVALTPRAGVRDGVDIRAGNSYVVAPPSTHPSGGIYRWLDEPPDGGLPTIRPAWSRLITGRPVDGDGRAAPPVRTAPIRDGAHGTRYGRAALHGVLCDLAGTPQGRRNQQTYAASRRVLDLHAGGHLPDLDTSLGAVADIAHRIGLHPAEVEKTIASARNGAHQPPPAAGRWP